MLDLTLVGVHDDGEHLVLISDDGQKFRVRVDEPLRAAVRRDRPRLGQLQLEMGGVLRPREIQARIRAGETAEHLAELSGLAVEHIRRYEGPVLAEREFVARQSRNVRMRGVSRFDGTVPTLGELVSERLGTREVEPQSIEWDAWRGEDGIWLINLTFLAGGRPRRAQWTYDNGLKHVHPLDDEARWLTEQQREGSAPGAAVNRRLISVRHEDVSTGESRTETVYETRTEALYDVEADGNVRPIEIEQTVAPEVSTVDLLDSLRERRGRRQRPGLDLDADDEDFFERAPAPSRPTPAARTEPSSDIPSAHPTRSRPDLAEDAEILDLIELESAVEEKGPTPAAVSSTSPRRPLASSARPFGLVHAAPTERVGQSADIETAADTPAAVANGAPAPIDPAHHRADERDTQPLPAVPKKGKRASVPSWDDIVFGGRRE